MSALYRRHELKAGKTMFFPATSFTQECVPYVLEFLIGSESDPAPVMGEIHPYRVRPSVALKRQQMGPVFKTRKAAMRAAKRMSQSFLR